jgi:hypothetical protein
MMEQPRCCHVCGSDFAPGDTLTDQWKIGAMGGDCAVRLFTFENAFKMSVLLLQCTPDLLYTGPLRFAQCALLWAGARFIQNRPSSCLIRYSRFPVVLIRQTEN